MATIKEIQQFRALPPAEQDAFLAAQEKLHMKSPQVLKQVVFGEAIKTQSKAAMLGSRVAAVKQTMSFVDWIFPIGIGVLILFLIIGPGMTIVFSILGSFTWYYWVGAIIMILILLRSR
tara:strand:- start:2086 stop:2442 length:357 start_codon:yes stop_codon:yes gene_type:complete